MAADHHAPELRVLTRPLGGSELARAAQIGAAPAEWYVSRPSGHDAWVERTRGIASDFHGGLWLAAIRPAFGDSAAATARLERVAREGGVVVTTGQQPGLFGGPIYTWSKALSTLALADEIERVSGVPAAPVFWAASDDSDFAEASVTYAAVSGGLETLALEPDPRWEGRPLRDVPLRGVPPLLERLERASGSALWPRALQLARSTYSDGVGIGEAYLALLRGMLEPLGVAVLDASHPFVRAAARPLLLRALERGQEIERALVARSTEIEAAGFSAQVTLVRGLALVFEIGDDGVRRRLPLRTPPDAVAGAELGPNVLLRPILERAILPTVGYVAGPGEIAYFAQVGAVADALGAVAPLVLPRWSGLVIEPHVARILERRATSVEELRDPSAAESRIARAALTDAERRGLAEAREHAAAAVRALRAGVGAQGGALLPEAALDGLERELEWRLARVERRVLAAVKRREHEALRDIATARAALWPLGQPQERALNLLPMLARHGPPLLDAMLARAREHAVALVAGGSPDGAGPASLRFPHSHTTHAHE